MSEMMRPLPFSTLMDWALSEYAAQGRIFGIRKEKFYQNTTGASMEIFGESLASPIGPAAGPNSQLAQNIVAAYLAGSRFIELKTVQKMDGDELRACVPRPCINAEDEGYNVEWSTELTVPQALEEYIKAWLAIHVLAKETGIAQTRDFVFNMSVGYDLEGIKTPKIDTYIESMKNAASTPVWQDAIAWLKQNHSRFTQVKEADIEAISPHVSTSVTLSTLHGCPPDEIERIAKYLLNEKGVHTFIKCNPTLLGYPLARRLLDEMGYGYISFDEHHFQNDLQYPDAVAMLQRLMDFAAVRNLSFGVKITNTFPVKIEKGELPGEEMYMSGRALFPLSIHVASKLATDFEGRLPISYSGGADAFNIVDIYKTGIRPITVATTILKPGGYERLKQLAESLEPLMRPEWPGINAAALADLAAAVPQMETYRKEARPVSSRKTSAPLGLYDCFMAPCRDGGCPIEQQIPEYLRLVGAGQYDEAFRMIAIDNAAPSVTGTICSHACQGKCTRLDYEAPLHIRTAKLLAAEAAQSAYTAALSAAPLKTDKTAVIVGAGPAGIAAALYLRRNGMQVTVLEKREKPFGVVQYIIPAFRISDAAMQRDYEMAVKAGVTFRFGVAVADIETLRRDYDFVLLAIGAWKEGAPAVEDGQEHLLDALAFLEESKRTDCAVPLGPRVAVVGGGDVAMDCARAAKRAPGTESVTLVYRRTRDFMPAQPEEVRLAIEDGVEIIELHAPKSYDCKTFRCEKMALGDWDASGRRSVNATGQSVELEFDTVICAVGARVDSSLFATCGLALDGRSRPVLSPACESSLPGVYVIGDCKAGPATVVAAMADAKAAAIDILTKLSLPHDFIRLAPAQDETMLYNRKGTLAAPREDKKDTFRCLGCDTLCEVCCDVCPNRANVRIAVPGMHDAHQILHIDRLCNECGNCGIFCPHQGAPYRDKLTVFWSEEDFADSENCGFLHLGQNQYMIRAEKSLTFTSSLDDARIPPEMRLFIETVSSQYPYYLTAAASETP